MRRLEATILGSAVLFGLAVLLGSAVPVDAHVHTTPASVKPGAKATVTFFISHGCSGSPTTKVAIKFPSSISTVSAVAPTGFTGSISGSVATFVGALPSAKKAGFGLTLVAPLKEGLLEFPTVQTCRKGSISWIQPTPPSGAEPTYPSPSVRVTSNP